ncbi:MAG TPA: Ku protein, partial [Methylomirabilota bacterium]|nr:Ku protein [Methylomirabilota bacterium]
MRPVWKGALSFGLVTIPVGMYPATARNDVSFRLLHAKDKSPIAYRRVCAEENVEVPWAEIVKGYEYEKGRFVEMTEADFDAADVEATQTIDIRDFVTAAEISPAYFEQPYYLAPEKTGGKAYALLREALRRSGRAGVATVVLRQREHPAAVQVRGDALTLTTMRFGHEIV